MENQIALGVHSGASAVDAPGDAAGVGAGRDDKVVLQLALIAVEDEIHAGVDLGIVDLAVGRDAGAPVLGVVADEVAHHAGLWVQSYCVGLGIGADQAHAQGVDGGGFGCMPGRRGRWRLLPLQVQDDFARSEEEGVAGTAREKLDRGGRLPLVRLETQRHADELRVAGSRWRGRLLVVSRGRGCARAGKTNGDGYYRERRY